MGHTIIKPIRDEDFYVVYSSVVDAPIRCGSRAELESTYEHAAADRLDRADETGTSSKLGWYGWDDQLITVREGFRPGAYPANAWAATVARADLRKLCESVDSSGYWNPPDGIVTWEFFDEEPCPHDSRSGDAGGRWRCDECGADCGPNTYHTTTEEKADA